MNGDAEFSGEKLVKYADQFLANRMETFRKDIERCIMEGCKIEPAYFPALMTCIAFTECMSGLLAGNLESGNDFAKLEKYSKRFLTERYDKLKLEILYEFRHKLAHLAYLHGVIILSDRRNRRRIIWEVFSNEPKPPIQIEYFDTKYLTHQMRLSELRGLRWADVDLEAGQIHVRQRADAWLKIGPTKSKAGMRDIPLAPMVVNTLKHWRIDCPKGVLDLVFPNTRGNVETMPNIHSRVWTPLQLKCGLTNDAGEARYGFHMLRHAAASLFIKYLGWSPKRLQAVMGHASINMTFDRYGHLFESVEADRADMAKIEAAVRAA